ncbi:hypothetical protein [Streptomyces sp. RKAG293]|uniref:hypothetical protein n=1 Tax=Streptomyces sp. RKAG293 TaxID=2893403 RepID=UPI002034788E|nr:hypothetical protein [Streptomyces sp. RKAG293]MCM2416692.1 hypothetical protein [Streptomyces sp. RKAG293]
MLEIDRVSGYAETNVRLPECAHEALGAIVAERGTSRDEALRQLLAAHVEVQEGRDPDDRLTHISTVLRYPPPPRWRTDPRQDRPLRLRVAADVLTRARSVSLHLPGQYERSHRDYQGRALTDAVMTAIAVREPFTDAFLDGLFPLLRQRAALALWRLAMAATSTRPERDLLSAAEDERILESCGGAADAHTLLLARALEEDAAWHSPQRFQVAQNIARDLLTGTNAGAHEDLLYEQDDQWEERYQDTLHAADDHRARLMEGSTAYDWSGRGGTAVWRARRHVDLRYFEDWLLQRPAGSDSEPQRKLDPPGWQVQLPGPWHARAPALCDGALPELYARWVADGKVLCFPFRDGQAV